MSIILERSPVLAESLTENRRLMRHKVAVAETSPTVRESRMAQRGLIPSCTIFMELINVVPFEVP